MSYKEDNNGNKQNDGHSKPRPAPVVYRDNYEHLEDELKRLDLMILQRVIELRRQNAARRDIALDAKMYVTDEEVNALLSKPKIHGSVPRELENVRRHIDELGIKIEARVSASREAGVFLALPQLSFIFALTLFESMVVVICLAPELRRKYHKLFVYLQDDIIRKKPGRDLILDLLCDGEAAKWKSRGYLNPQASLFRTGILEISDDYPGFLELSPRILHFILGHNHLDDRLMETGAVKLFHASSFMEDVLMDEELKTRLSNITRGHRAIPDHEKKQLVLHFHGPAGVGKRELATALCTEMNAYMLQVDLEQLAAAGGETRNLLRAAFREGLLMQVVLYIDGIDVLQPDAQDNDLSVKSLLKTVAAAIEEFGWLVILAGEKPWSVPADLFKDAVFHSTHLPVPPMALRQKAWEQSLKRSGLAGDPGAAEVSGVPGVPGVSGVSISAEQMARQYRLTPGQIKRAAEYTYYHDILGSGEVHRQPTTAQLAEAGRRMSNRKLAQLAAKIESKSQWDDIILPDQKKKLLQEICTQVKYRHQVFDQWGFGKKQSHGHGLSVLFSGSPGTGKTMAAGVMAKELQLDLYKLDLSGIVSKYIGETEKNLSRIFHEAETGNCILFFDEADALFGKRSEVSDAHDRYANIETSYLLQKMEEYEGIVILATNFRKNMDEAFTRRIRYIVDFPFPDESSRLSIWQSHFPPEAPRTESIDYKHLARKFQLSGGNIKNIVLDAAFQAARNGGVISMDHLLQGTRREYEKIGRLWES